MNLRQRVLGTLTNEYPGDLTNQQLAVRLDAPEPSVRRATRELEDSGDVCMAGERGYGSIGWKRRDDRMATPTPVQDTVVDHEVSRFEDEGGVNALPAPALD